MTSTSFVPRHAGLRDVTDANGTRDLTDKQTNVGTHVGRTCGVELSFQF